MMKMALGDDSDDATEDDDEHMMMAMIRMEDEQ